MKRLFLFFIFIFLSCSDIQPCPEIKYNPINKVTQLDGDNYTGRCAVYNNGSRVSIQQYVNGVDYGVWLFYHSNGKIETKGRFRDGKRVGKWRYYYESGKIKQVSSYSKIGERSGKWIYYNEKGEKTNTVIYQ